MSGTTEKTQRLRRFVVTGCGRSGTTYMSALLTRLGCTCVHEKYFPWLRRIGPLFLSPEHRFHVRLFRAAWPVPPWGEAAWQAAPYVTWLPRGTVVLHQVRNPIKTMRSRQKKGLTYIPFRKQVCPVPVASENEAEFARRPFAEQAVYLAEFWIHWNTMIEAASTVSRLDYVRYRLEDLTPTLIDSLLRRVGCEPDPHTLDVAFAETDRNMHTRGETDRRLTLDLLPVPLRRRMEDVAGRYGYSAGELEEA